MSRGSICHGHSPMGWVNHPRTLSVCLCVHSGDGEAIVMYDYTYTHRPLIYFKNIFLPLFQTDTEVRQSVTEHTKSIDLYFNDKYIFVFLLFCHILRLQCDGIGCINGSPPFPSYFSQNECVLSMHTYTISYSHISHSDCIKFSPLKLHSYSFIYLFRIHHIIHCADILRAVITLHILLCTHIPSVIVNHIAPSRLYSQTSLILIHIPVPNSSNYSLRKCS